MSLKKKSNETKNKKIYIQKKKELEEKQCYKTRAVFYYNTVLKTQQLQKQKEI